MTINLKNYQDTTMHNSIFICQTYYHLLIAVLLNIKDEKKNDLIIFGEINDRVIKDKQTTDKLIKSNIFNKIEIIDCSDLKKQKTHKRVLTTISRIKRDSTIKRISNYNEIYIFNDLSSIGKVINRKNVKYNLIEDGRSCFNEKHYKKIISQQGLLKRIIKKILFGYSFMGESKNIKKIFVNDLEDTYFNQNIEECNLDNLIEGLGEEEKLKVVGIFLDNEIKEYISNSVIVLTQPFFMDGILKSEQDQLQLYKDIIDSEKYSTPFLKLHPRDTLNYEKIISKEKIIQGDFPIEIINLIPDLRIKKVISVSSTATKSIGNCEENIVLGWDYLEKYKNHE